MYFDRMMQYFELVPAHSKLKIELDKDILTMIYTVCLFKTGRREIHVHEEDVQVLLEH